MKKTRFEEKQALCENSKAKIKKYYLSQSKKVKTNYPDIYHLDEIKLPNKKIYKHKTEKALSDVTLLVGNEWLNSSEMAEGMLLIQQKFPDCNILTGSPYFNYERGIFDKNLLFGADGNHICIPNTFLR